MTANCLDCPWTSDTIDSRNESIDHVLDTNHEVMDQ